MSKLQRHETLSRSPRTQVETIAAIITPPGEGGVAAVRIAGPDSTAVLDRHFRPSRSSGKTLTPFLLRLGKLVATNGEILDEVMAVFMPLGHSYTGLDQVEIFCHGGRQVVRRILEEILNDKVRAAEPGEFTRLAFESGRIDLSKAEAVAEMITAQTDISLRASREHLLGKYSEHIDMLRESIVGVLSEIEASIDFTEDAPEASLDRGKLLKLLDQVLEQLTVLVKSYEGGRIINEGFTVVIGGRPNAGKSSLFNLLLKEERALVTPTAGTTRDYLMEKVDLGGHAVNLIDTAGLRQGGGKVEREGQTRAKDLIFKSDLLVWVVDLSQSDWKRKLSVDIKPFVKSDIIILGNKIDKIKSKIPIDKESGQTVIRASCESGSGITELWGAIHSRIEKSVPDLTSGLVVTSVRHKQKLASAIRQLKEARVKITRSIGDELIAHDLKQVVSALGEITGKVYTEEIIGRIFSKFCVGK